MWDVFKSPPMKIGGLSYYIIIVFVYDVFKKIENR